MTIATALQAIETSLYGSKLTEQETGRLTAALPSSVTPLWLLRVLAKYGLAGVNFTLEDGLDESELGVEMKWLHADEMIEEALMCYPGKPALNAGFLPIGACLLGSGDPYFLKLEDGNESDPALVRIPHESVVSENEIREDSIEVVSDSLSRFFELATVD